MPQIDLSILNQKQTPAFYADTLANRPAAGYVGRVFISTDTLDLYRDTGTTWVLLSPSSTGGVTGSGSLFRVAIWNSTSSIGESANLVFDYSTGHLGINTSTPGTALDVHHDQSTILQLNQTVATNDTRIAFQNSGTAKWRIGNFYNGGSNDYKIFDVLNNIERFTIKNTGQTFVGLETTSSGKLVVNSSVSDNHIVVIGANAPSIRVRNAGTGASLQIGLGLATTNNNYIQGTIGGEFCIFNDSVTPLQPILFGINTGFITQEVARFSSSLNLLVGSTIDTGERVQVSGNVKATNFVKSGGTSAELLAADGSSVSAGSGITITGGTISSSGGGGGINTANFSIAQIIDFTGAPSATYTFASLFPSITTFANKTIHMDMQFIYEQSPGNIGSFYYNVIREKAATFFQYAGAYQQFTSGLPSFPSFIFGGSNGAPDLTFYLFSGGFASVNITITLSS